MSDPPSTRTAAALAAPDADWPGRVRVALADGRLLDGDACLRRLPDRRLVLRARIEGRRVLAKLFVGRGAARGAEREVLGLSRAAAAGLPAPALLERAVLEGGGEALLIEWIDGAVDAGDAVAVDPAAQLPRIAALVGRAHRAGIAHGDPHLGNFLWDGTRMVLIDGADIVAVPPPDDAAAVDALARLAAQAPAAAPLPAADMLDAWAEGAGRARPATPAALLQRTGFRRQLRIAHWFAKTRRDCTEFARRRRGLRVHRAVRAEAPAEVLDGDPRHWFEAGTRLGQDAVWTRIGSRRGLLLRLRGGRGERAWRDLLRGRWLDLAVPRPLALVSRPLAPLARISWLLCDPRATDPAALAPAAAVAAALDALEAAGVGPRALAWCPLCVADAAGPRAVPLHRVAALLPPGRSAHWPDAGARRTALVDALLASARPWPPDPAAAPAPRSEPSTRAPAALHSGADPGGAELR